jgi:hypothetical protein
MLSVSSGNITLICALTRSGRRFGCMSFPDQLNYRSGNAATSKSYRRPPKKKLEQFITAVAPHQFHDIKTKCKVDYFELLDLLVAELDRRFNQPGMHKLLVIERVLTGTMEPNDIDVVMDSYSVYISSRSSLIRQL